jgi:hypothetical protein
MIYEKFKKALLNTTTKEHKEEIMKLKFGCNIEYCDRKWQELLDHAETYKGKISCIIDKYSQKDFGEYQSKIIIVGDDGVWEINGNNNIYEGFKDGHLELLEIIGRDITLEDVLMALEEKEKEWYVEWGNIGVTTSIKVLTKSSLDGDDDEFIWIVWQLGKPAHEQSDKTLKKIIDLLK